MESWSPPGQVCTPMWARSAGVKRASTRLLRATKASSRPLEGSSLIESRPSVKSSLHGVGAGVERAADVGLGLVDQVFKKGSSRGYPSMPPSGYSRLSADGAMTACLTGTVAWRWAARR